MISLRQRRTGPPAGPVFVLSKFCIAGARFHERSSGADIDHGITSDVLRTVRACERTEGLVGGRGHYLNSGSDLKTGLIDLLKPFKLRNSKLARNGDVDTDRGFGGIRDCADYLPAARFTDA